MSYTHIFFIAKLAVSIGGICPLLAHSTTTLHAKSAIYDPKSDTVTLTSDAMIKHGRHTLTSAHITYNNTTHIATATGNVRYKASPSISTLELWGDMATYHQSKQKITITNNARAYSPNGILESDTLVYDTPNDTVQANGNIVFYEPDGNTSTMRTLVANTDFTEIHATDVKRSLNANVLVSAKTFQRSADGNSVAYEATYTSCIVYPDADTPPTWLIRSKKVELQENGENITFTNSYMELFNTPVYYWPYFEQPTPKVRKKDGWLLPDLGTSNTDGIYVKGYYYTSINDTSDLVISPFYRTKKTSGIDILYRKNTPNSILRHNVSMIPDGDKNAFQGHWFSTYTVTAKHGWQYKVKHENATYTDYLKKNIFLRKSHLDTLTSSFQATKVIDNDIFVTKGASYRDTRNNASPVTTLLPYTQYTGYRKISNDSSLHIKAISRNLQKRGILKSHTTSATLTYSHNMMTPQGIQFKTDIVGRTDYYTYGFYKTRLYNGKDRTKGTLTRFTPMASIVTSYPLLINHSNTPNLHIIIEPVVGVFLSKAVKNPKWIPNNDSLDFELDESNLFSNNRYAGVDKIDAGRRLSYGGRLKVWQDDTYIQAFLGQNITQGANRMASDFIGSFSARWHTIQASANFELDSRTFTARKLESQLEWQHKKFTWDVGHTKINPREATQIEPLSQTKFGMAYQISKNWQLRTVNYYEFNKKNKGLIRQALGLGYTTDCGCLSIDFEYKKDFSKSRSTPEQSFFMSISLREIGNVQRRF